MSNLTYLGVAFGVSKKTEKPFFMAHFYGEDTIPNSSTIGLRSFSYFITEDLFNSLKVLDPLTPVLADIRYINGSNILIGVQEVN